MQITWTTTWNLHGHGENAVLKIHDIHCDMTTRQFMHLHFNSILIQVQFHGLKVDNCLQPRQHANGQQEWYISICNCCFQNPVDTGYANG